ncbi:MAG: trigger factor [Mariprofundaceae bacterium]
MVQTEVKEVGVNEHQVNVRLPQEEYDRIYAVKLAEVSGQAKLPGFRPGKTPANVIQKQFGPKLHEDTVSELLQTHYVAVIESSGLTPAVQPELDLPSVQSGDGFEFTLKVTTWPEVKLKKVSKLKFNETTVTVEDADIEAVVGRLRESQVRFEVEDGRVAEQGDQATIDFVGFVDGEAFEGGKGEDTPLVLGEGRFIPGFEEQLIGKKAGEDCTVDVTFPEQYQAAHLAGKSARFETQIKSVGKPVKASNDDDLAEMLGFENGEALIKDARDRLTKEAEEASYQNTRDGAFEALIAANDVTLSERLIADDMRATTQRVQQNMQQQGVPSTEDMFKDDAFKDEIRKRSERGLTLSVLLQAIREQESIEIADDVIDGEIAKMGEQYPEEQRAQYAEWVKSQQEQMSQVRERLLERKCVEYIISVAKTKAVNKPLSDWQSEQEAQA